MPQKPHPLLQEAHRLMREYQVEEYFARYNLKVKPYWIGQNERIGLKAYMTGVPGVDIYVSTLRKFLRANDTWKDQKLSAIRDSILTGMPPD